MSVETRAYDNQYGEPVAVMVVTGQHDVSRLVALLHRGTCEQVEHGDRLNRQLRRHNGGRAALALLKAHGGPDFTATPGQRELIADALDSVLEWRGTWVKGPHVSQAPEQVLGDLAAAVLAALGEPLG